MPLPDIPNEAQKSYEHGSSYTRSSRLDSYEDINDYIKSISSRYTHVRANSIYSNNVNEFVD